MVSLGNYGLHGWHFSCGVDYFGPLVPTDKQTMVRAMSLFFDLQRNILICDRSLGPDSCIVGGTVTFSKISFSLHFSSDFLSKLPKQNANLQQANKSL